MIIRYIAQLKIYLTRVQSYLAILNFAMIVSLFVDSVNASVSIIARLIIYLVGFLLVILWGYFDTKFKVFENEQRKINNENPQILDIQKKVTEIERQIKLIITSLKQKRR